MPADREEFRRGLGELGFDAVRFAAVGADSLEQRVEAGQFAAGDDRCVASAGEAAGDGAAGGVAGADDQG